MRDKLGDAKFGDICGSGSAKARFITATTEKMISQPVREAACGGTGSTARHGVCQDGGSRYDEEGEVHISITEIGLLGEVAVYGV